MSRDFRIKVSVRVLWFCLYIHVGFSQTPGIVCSYGSGRFETKFRTGVSVYVGPTKNGQLSNRSCGAILSWGRKSLVVAENVQDVDIDALGVDLGLGGPVVALQTRESGRGSPVEYRIFSLRTPPRLLRTIAGGDFFSASDTDMDGRIEIWTTDSAAIDDFEDLPSAAYDFAPTVVLRFEKGRLADVSSEFVSYFDDRIKKARAGVDEKDLVDFKKSDGKLLLSSVLPRNLARLRATKIRVLEIVWSYLYSGRAQEAWRELASMWPPADLDRIRLAVAAARSLGIRSQVDVDAPESADGSLQKKQVPIYRLPSGDLGYYLPTVLGYNPPPESRTSGDSSANLVADTGPVPILLRRAVTHKAEQLLATSEEEKFYVIVDAAGKVRASNQLGETDPECTEPCINWRFIPAFKNGSPVASRMRLSVTLQR